MRNNNLFERDTSDISEIFEPKSFWRKNREILETNEIVKEKLEAVGVERIELDGLQEKFQTEILKSTEHMLEEYPEIEGYITSIRAVQMPKGVLARSGPRYTEDGYEGVELQFNKEFFGRKTYALDIVDMESDVNWRGEKWIAGQGAEAIICHEIGHALALKLNADSVGIEMGEDNLEKYEQLQKEYNRNFLINNLCYESFDEAGITPRDMGLKLSTYGAQDFGEAFAECISEVETKKHPRVYARTVVDKYRKLVNEKREVA